ncbi:hypothetical protein F2Q70_00015270 [Brassica cretica]|uniref:Uncharacterized protein n=1 Tax=Brassica cretica TaxID=69181 RepID=A0A8S9I1M0_BRACR|nr:hypothetical protein F2Q70_00015270 [Brassica cretica]
MIKWRCCPRLVQFHGFRSVEVLLDTPPRNPKNCPGAKGGLFESRSVRPNLLVSIRSSRGSVQVEISSVQSSRDVHLGFWLSDQPAASRLEHLQVLVIFKDSVVAGGRTIWGIFGHIGRSPSLYCWFLTLSHNSGLGTGLGLVCISLVFPLLEARSWQEAKSNLVTVALGKDDRIPWCWTSWSKFCDSDRIVPNPSRNASGLWCWVERSAMFLFDCWLAGRFGGVTVSIFDASTMASWDSGCLMGRVRFGFLPLVQSVSAMRAVDGRF